ncbi:MAG TPA: hypothetical protein VE197_05880 [Mycobacterium sp.]|nr:hypothetical protein [Mycobacterium sp.]
MTTNTVPTSSAPTVFDAGLPSVSTCGHLELEPSRHRDAVEDRDDESVGLKANMDDRWIGEVINAARRGGFSLHDRIGDAPRSGYMVSVTSQNIKHISHINADHFRNFVMHHRHLLADPSNYLGGWLDNDGSLYTDISSHKPDFHVAVAKARDNDQLAIYDLGTGHVIPIPGMRDHRLVA